MHFFIWVFDFSSIFELKHAYLYFYVSVVYIFFHLRAVKEICPWAMAALKICTELGWSDLQHCLRKG